MNSLFDVSGKVAVVTGGSGVLGSNISEGLLKAGAKVAVIGAHSDRVEKAWRHNGYSSSRRLCTA